MNSQSLNRYGYVGNRPVNFNDPTGHESKYGCYQSSGNDCLNSNGTKIIEGNGKGGAPKNRGRSSGNNIGNNGDNIGIFDNDLQIPQYIEDSLANPYYQTTQEYWNQCIQTCHDNSRATMLDWTLYGQIEPFPFLPDYVVFDIGVPVVSIIGLEIQPIVLDKYGNVYRGLGPGIGTSPIMGWKANASVSFGYILDVDSTEDEAESFIQNWSLSGCAGFGPGGCVTDGDPINPNFNEHPIAIQIGGFSPQIGGSLTYGSFWYDDP